MVPTELAVGEGPQAGRAGAGQPAGESLDGAFGPGVGIHGTPNGGSIGYSVSHGCIRMYIPDAEWLFNTVDIGSQVFIVSS